MLRLAVATHLRNDSQMQVACPGGIYPTADSQASEMSKEAYPNAFDSTGLIRSCCLVQDDGSFTIPAITRGESGSFRIFVWQPFGRESIDAILVRIREVLSPLTLQIGTLWVYELQWAGDGPNLQDQALDDAELGWSRWQTIAVR